MSGDERWRRLLAATPARLGLGRSGASLPTREVLRFGLAHAQARDAVHLPLDAARLAADLAATGLPVLSVASAAEDRAAYLARPDRGRQLREDDRATIAGSGVGPADLAIVVGDGLSAVAVQRHAPALVEALLPLLSPLEIAPLVVATQARVALGDAVAVALGARAVLTLIGERPGLSSPDSLGAYLTFAPTAGTTDAQRNCVSNIRQEGLAPARAAQRLAWLIREAFRLGLTGIGLKDGSALPPPEHSAALPKD